MHIDLINDRDTWNDHLRRMPGAHILQTWEWGAFKQATTGWRPERLVFRDVDGGDVVAMASVLTRFIGPLAVIYVPKGPVFARTDDRLVNAVLDHLQGLARRQFAVWLKIDPDVIAATGVPGEPEDTPYLPGQRVLATLKGRGWRFSGDQVQFRNTIIIDLTRDEDDILAAMSQNTRRKVRAAEKKSVRVRAATPDDLPVLYDLYRVTGQRDDFLIRPAEYYQQAWRDFMQAGLAHALLAEVDGQPVAHVILFHFGQTCWYMYGASGDAHREKMPNYALQWAAIQWAKAQGYTRYDLWGAPDAFTESDSMWGVYTFKRGFRGTVTRHIGAWDYAPFPPVYYAYAELWPRLRAMLRGGTHASPGTEK